MSGSDPFAMGMTSRARSDLRTEIAWKETCMCPVCKTVWQHKDSPSWIREHFGIDAGPITCSECGTVSVSQEKIGPRKLYVAPQAVPHPTRTDPYKTGWFGRKAREGKTDDWDYERG